MKTAGIITGLATAGGFLYLITRPVEAEGYEG